MAQHPTSANWASIGLLGLVWGGTFMVVSIALRDYGPLTVACAQVFPGCTVGTWKPTKQKAKGKVEEALAYVQMYFEDYPDGVLLLKELRSVIGDSYNNAS